MSWFSLLFPPAMILIPAVTAFALPTAPGPREMSSARLRGPRTILLLFTALALGLWLALWLFLPAVWSTQTWALCFLVWPAAVPYMKARAEGTGPGEAPEPPPRVRAASLDNRARGNPVPARAWAPGWSLFVSGAVALMMRLTLPFPDGAAWIRWGVATGLFAVIMTGLLLGAPVVVRRALIEAEPRDPDGRDDVARAWDRFRRGRSWGLYAGCMMMALLTTGLAVTLAWIPADPRLGARVGVIFGVAGAAVGAAGAVFGFTFGRERVRIERRVRELAGNGGS